MKTLNTTALTKALLLSLAAAPAVLLAQASTPAPAATANADEETIMLSPFEVNSKKDVGYVATNTLAGSRLNTELKDTAASISVLTPEFMKDIGATNMKDLIMFQNNAVPDIGDADNSINGNPLIGRDEWQLRIRGQAASYARNYFTWENSSDLYNVERVDQARGPNSILFGFGSPGGIVNTSTKQALLTGGNNEVSATVGSWNRYRTSFDYNYALVPGKFALRVNAMLEDGESWRLWEFNKAKRAHIAAKWAPSKTSNLRAEFEAGQVDDNVARPWLAVDQSSIWRGINRPLYNGSWQTNWSTSGVSSFWPDHYVVNDSDKKVHNWLGMPFATNDNPGAAGNWVKQTWAAWPMTAAGLAIIPQETNTAGPDATRKTTYSAFTTSYDNQLTEKLSLQVSLNHQTNHFKGYDADGSRATTYYGSASEVWGDASYYLPDWTVNPNAGKLYLENNWTRRDQHISSTNARISLAYDFSPVSWMKNRIAGMYEHMWRNFDRLEESLVFSTRKVSSAAAYADVNRVYTRHYFTPGVASDIRVASWKTLTDGTTWVANQAPEDTKQDQDTFMAAMQSSFLKEKLVTTLGIRADRMGLDYNPGSSNYTPDTFTLDPANKKSTTFDATTFTTGAVYHVTKGVSVYGNHSNSRQIPNLGIHTIGSYIAPMPKSEGYDAGLKFDLLDGKVFATVGYYTTDAKNLTDWSNVQTAVTDRNTTILNALLAQGKITPEERSARLINANGYLHDREASGWEFTAVANPTPNWRISANFSINDAKAQNSMVDVKAWADENSAWWKLKGGANFNIDPANPEDWESIGNQIEYMYGAIDPIVGLDGKAAKGERKYNANTYTKYSFSSGFLKGLSIGGGARYQSANVLGMYYGEVCYGRSVVLADAMIQYAFPARWVHDKAWIDLQLNASNVLNTRRYQVYSLAWWDTSRQTAERIGLQEPRKLTFSATLRF